MKYKIIVWKYHVITDTHESDSIEELKNICNEKYASLYNKGECFFEVFEDNIEIEFQELLELGFLEY